MRISIEALRDEFRYVEVVELLEYAHEMLEEAPEMSEELMELRWERFGRLAEQIVEARERSLEWCDIEAVDELRLFCFNEELRRAEAAGWSGVQRLMKRIFRTTWGTITSN